jgi:hypothetical protein
VARRAQKSAHIPIQNSISSHFASRRWSLLSQNQTSIHCLGPKAVTED